MSRIQFFEFEDQQWLPIGIRNGITDFIQFAVVRSNLYDRFLPRLVSAIRRSGSSSVVDLCSGAGGPWSSLLPTVRELAGMPRLTLCLTDLFPNRPALGALAKLDPAGLTRSADFSVSATKVPDDLRGFRTLFSSFHHFPEQAASEILADAIRHRQGICIAESTQRHPLLIAYMLLTPALVLLSSPFQKPFRWSRMFWTYIVPAVPLAVMFDGVVSCLRTYSPQELLSLCRNIPGHESFDWDAGIERIGKLPIGVTYLIGLPKTSQSLTE